MSIQYSGNVHNVTFTPTNKQDLINNMETVLLAAGWTTISGHNTTSLVMESAATPASLAMRIHVKDNGGTCVVVSIANTAETHVAGNSTTAGIQLNPGASSILYRMVAGPYQAFIWSAAPTPARQFGGWGVPAIPSFLNSLITEAMWAMGNTLNDTSTSIMRSWRTCLGSVQSGTGLACNQQLLCNGNLWELANTAGPSTGIGELLLLSGSENGNNPNMYKWHDGSANLVDAVVGWGLTSFTDAALLRGQLWDAMVATDAYTADIAFTADSHNWIVLTDNNVGVNQVLSRGSLILATS